MINKQKRRIIEEEVISLTCDVCKTTYADEMEIQEFLNIAFTGGYNSVFGDGVKVSCDICQHCLLKNIGSICRKENSQQIFDDQIKLLRGTSFPIDSDIEGGEFY